MAIRGQWLCRGIVPLVYMYLGRTLPYLYTELSIIYVVWFFQVN